MTVVTHQAGCRIRDGVGCEAAHTRNLEKRCAISVPISARAVWAQNPMGLARRCLRRSARTERVV